MRKSCFFACLPKKSSLVGCSNFSYKSHTYFTSYLQFAETLGIMVDIQEADWARNLAMDCSKLQAHGIVFDTTQAGLTRCLRDYGLL